ncbi:MAG: hypothetical protein ACI8Y4_004559 [Candidatus Poriferisodalaceae bacterium]|jgi:hypothetical protein
MMNTVLLRRRRRILLSLLPVFAGIAGLSIGYIAAGFQTDRFAHEVALVAAESDRVSRDDHRDLAYELSTAARDHLTKPGDVSVRVTSHQDAVLEIRVEAPSAEEASLVATELADKVIEQLSEAAFAGQNAVIKGGDATVVDLRAMVDELDDRLAEEPSQELLTQLQRDRQTAADALVGAEIDLLTAQNYRDASPAPIALSRSNALDQIAPRRERTASIAGAVAMMLTFLLLMVSSPRLQSDS